MPRGVEVGIATRMVTTMMRDSWRNRSDRTVVMVRSRMEIRVGVSMPNNVPRTAWTPTRFPGRVKEYRQVPAWIDRVEVTGNVVEVLSPVVSNKEKLVVRPAWVVG